MFGFDKVLTTLRLYWSNVDTTFFRRCFNVGFWRCINVVQRWKTHVRFCFNFNVGSTLFQRWSIMLKQRYPTLKCWLGNSCSALPVKKFVNTFQGRLYWNIKVVNISNKSRDDHTQKTSRRTKLISTFYSTHPPHKCHTNAISDTVM